MTSLKVATAAAASRERVARYAAADPRAAAVVPDTSASPNRASHDRHHALAICRIPRRLPACRPGTGPLRLAGSSPRARVRPCVTVSDDGRENMQPPDRALVPRPGRPKSEANNPYTRACRSRRRTEGMLSCTAAAGRGEPLYSWSPPSTGPRPNVNHGNLPGVAPEPSARAGRPGGAALRRR